MARRIPVLDDDTRDAAVIGYATTERGALRVIRKYSDTPLVAINIRRDPVTYDPDINTRKDADAVARHGAWAPLYWINPEGLS